MPLPTLTWSQTGYQSTGYLAPTDAQVIDAIIANAASMLTSWRVISSSASTYIELGAPTGSPVENMRIIIAVNPGASADLVPDTAANAIWYGFAPDGGTLGTWNSATPYGADRFSLYWRCAATGLAESFYFIESNEALAIVFRDDSTDNFYCGLAGAIFNPLDFDAEADGRLYGMLTTSSRPINVSNWNSHTEFMSFQNSAGYAHAGCFNPLTPTQWLRLNRVDGNYGVGPSTYKSGNSKEIKLPPVYQDAFSPWANIGVARQLYKISDRINRTEITGEGLVLSSTTSGTSDAVLFGNS